MQALPAAPESLCIVEMGGTESKEETGETGTVGGLFLNTGLQVLHIHFLNATHIRYYEESLLHKQQMCKMTSSFAQSDKRLCFRCLDCIILFLYEPRC